MRGLRCTVCALLAGAISDQLSERTGGLDPVSSYDVCTCRARTRVYFLQLDSVQLIRTCPYEDVDGSFTMYIVLQMASGSYPQYGRPLITLTHKRRKCSLYFIHLSFLIKLSSTESFDIPKDIIILFYGHIDQNFRRS